MHLRYLNQVVLIFFIQLEVQRVYVAGVDPNRAMYICALYGARNLAGQVQRQFAK